MQKTTKYWIEGCKFTTVNPSAGPMWSYVPRRFFTSRMLSEKRYQKWNFLIGAQKR